MKKILALIGTVVVLSACTKTVEFGNGKYTATYDSSLWDLNENGYQLTLKADDSCWIYLDAGGKGLMGTDFTYEDGENGAVVTNGKYGIVRITKKIGDPENPTLVEIVPAISEKPEECIKAGYEVLNTLK